MTDREQVRVIVVSDHRRGTVHAMTNDHAEAQRWTRELIAKYGGDNLSAGMTAGLVDVPTPETAARVRARVAAEIAEAIEREADRLLKLPFTGLTTDVVVSRCRSDAEIARQHATPEEPA